MILILKQLIIIALATNRCYKTATNLFRPHICSRQPHALYPYTKHPLVSYYSPYSAGVNYTVGTVPTMYNRVAKVAVAKRYITLLSFIPILFIPSIFPDLIATLKLTVIRILLTTDNQGICLFLSSCKQKLQISCNSESCSICNSILKVDALYPYTKTLQCHTKAPIVPR